MIFDSLAHAVQYAHDIPEYKKAFAFLEKCMKETPAPGRYELDGDRLYASVQNYVTKDEADVRWEAHRKYIDIQCLLSGRERIGRADLADLANPGAYDPERDVLLADGAHSAAYLTLTGGTFAVFYPWDAHRPCLADGEKAEVVKVVVKVMV